MSGFDKLVLAGVILLLLPVLLSPAGWIVGIVLAVLWITIMYGGRYLLDLEKHRREGERGLASDVRTRARQDRRRD